MSITTYQKDTNEQNENEVIVLPSSDVMAIFRSLILKEMKKRLVWKDKRCKGSNRFKIKNVPSKVAHMLFPCLSNQSIVRICDEDTLERTFENIGKVYCDFLSHLPEECGNSLCLLHCDRVSMKTPVVISWENNILQISFWIKRIGPGGTVY